MMYTQTEKKKSRKIKEHRMLKSKNKLIPWSGKHYIYHCVKRISFVPLKYGFSIRKKRNLVREVFVIDPHDII